MRLQHPVLRPAIAEGPCAARPERTEQCFKPGVTAPARGQGDKAARPRHPQSPTCASRLHSVLLSANQRKGTPLHTQPWGVNAPHPSLHYPHPPPGTPRTDQQFPSPRPASLVRPPLRERAGGQGSESRSRPHLWLAPHSRRLLSAAWKDPPRSPQSWRASAPCPELPRGPPRPAAPRAPPPLSGLASPAAGRGESAAGWERGIQSVPLPPISRPPSFLGGGRSPPGLGPQTPSWLRRGYSPRARSSSPSGRAAAAASAPHPTPLFPRLTPPPRPARSAPAHKSFMSRLRGPPGWLPERRPRSPARLPDRPWDRAGLERRRPWRRAGEARGRGCRGTCCRPPTPLARRSRAGT